MPPSFFVTQSGSTEGGIRMAKYGNWRIYLEEWRLGARTSLFATVLTCGSVQHDNNRTARGCAKKLGKQSHSAASTITTSTGIYILSLLAKHVQHDALLNLHQQVRKDILTVTHTLGRL